MAQGLDTLAMMRNFAASLGCPDCVDVVEPCVWRSFRRLPGNESSRQARALQLRARCHKTGRRCPPGCPPRRGVRRLARGRPDESATGRQGPGVRAGRFCSSRTRSGKRKNNNDYTTARTPCRPAARRRRDLKPPARRAARLDRVYGKCTAAAARTTGEAPPHLRRRPAARRRRRRGESMKKHKPSRPHKYVEMRPAKRARARTRT